MEPHRFRILTLAAGGPGGCGWVGEHVKEVAWWAVAEGGVCVPLDGGDEVTGPEEREGTDGTACSYRRYERVAVAGTFDHLHEGHKMLLKGAALVAESDGIIDVGITAGKLLSGKAYAGHVQPWEQRKEGVVEFLSSIYSGTIRAFELTDVYGPLLVDMGIKCLVVSEETKHCAGDINLKRKERLDIAIAPLVMLGTRKVSSTDIRKGME